MVCELSEDWKTWKANWWVNLCFATEDLSYMRYEPSQRSTTYYIPLKFYFCAISAPFGEGLDWECPNLLFFTIKTLSAEAIFGGKSCLKQRLSPMHCVARWREKGRKCCFSKRDYAFFISSLFCNLRFLKFRFSRFSSSLFSNLRFL